MKRGIFGLCTLLVFLFLGLWGSYAMGDFHGPISDSLEQAGQAALAGDMANAVQTAKAAQRKWENGWSRVAVLADHTPMDEIDGMFARLEMYAQAGNTADFAAHCNQLAVLITATAEAHELSWRNLL